MTRGGAWTVCLSLTVFAAAGTARSATPLSVSLRYDVDPSLSDCPGEDEFRRHVVEQLGTDPFREGAAHHIDARAPRPAVVSPAREIALPAVTTTPTAAPRPRPSFFASLGPVASVGEAPAASAGVELSGAARLRAFSLDLGARATFPVTFRQGDGTGVRASALAGTLAVCGHLRGFALCPLATLGRLRVSGLGVDDARAPASTTARVGLRGAFEQPLSARLAAVLHADGAYTLTPRTVTLNQLPVWKTAALGLAVGIDLAVLFR